MNRIRQGSGVSAAFFIIRVRAEPRKKRAVCEIVENARINEAFFKIARGVCYNTRVEKRTKTIKIYGILLLCAALAVMLWQLFTIYTAGMRHVLHGLLLIAAVCAPLIFGTWLITRAMPEKTDRRRAVRFALFALFIFYCAALAGALIVSRVDYSNFVQSRADYLANFDRMTNFIPFETVRLYLNAIKYDYIGMEIPLSNLVGNAMLFMPMAVFLPCLFRPMRRLWLFALTMALALVAVEAAQLLLACGSCDIDDVLLNLTGTLIVFGILKTPALQRLLRKLYLLPDVPESTEPPAPATA